jgi:hypothetical protein
MSALAPLKRYRKKWRSQREWSLRDSFWRELGTGLRGQLFLDRGEGLEATTLLAGTARSGTSWISEVLNHGNEYRMIHEPLRRDRLAATKVFRPRHYLRPDDRDPACLQAMETILSGRARSLWTDKYNRKMLPAHRLIREVRGNLLLPWVHRQFPQVRLVLLLRHPCAVVNSQLKWGRMWPIKLERFLDERDLMAPDLLGPFEPQILAAMSAPPFEQHVMAWCLENYVPLKQLDPGQAHVAFYESFVLQPQEELGRLLRFLGKELAPAALQALQQPSNSTRKDSAIVAGGDLLAAWKKELGREQADRAVELLTAFGLDRIYGAEATPLVSDPAEVLGLG